MLLEFIAQTLNSTGDFPFSIILWSILILATAAFIQATVGFAAALFGLPLLLWVGIDLMTSQVLIITAMLPQNMFAVWKLRHSIDYREIVFPATIRIGALPIGVAGLALVMSWSAESINQFVGLLILLAVIVQSFVDIEWKNADHPFWIIVTFGSSGILQGISGMSGPPMVLWVHGRRYSADRARAFLFAMYISNFIPQICLLHYKFGTTVWQAVGVATLSIPFVLASAALGLRLGSWLGDRWLRPITYVCLLMLALSSLLDPWLKW
ncbi:MAG: sulfite exporter TauE/SafE family protein [Planctomycetales bacterium]|nr:sulfite exporter TauE/SafE family protein [Planctomycetales bacterium]